MALSDVGTNLATSLLYATGSDWAYSRGQTSGTVSFYRADLPPLIVDNGMGQAVEVIMTSFRGLLSEFTALFEKPLRGDKITDGTTTYEVQPIQDKCYYTVGGLLHIHAKRVSG